MAPLRLSMNGLALALRVPVTRVAEIVHERRAVTPDTALRLARYFNTSPRFWMNLQAAYDLELARKEIEPQVVRDVPAPDGGIARPAPPPIDESVQELYGITSEEPHVVESSERFAEHSDDS